jgi:lipoprotein-releasing system permease protein
MQTLFIASGVAIGVAVIIFMSALLAGLQANFIHRVLSSQAHIQLLPPKETVRPAGTADFGWPGALADARIQAPLQRLKSIDQWQAISTQIRRMPEVVVVSPVASGSALMVRGDANRAVSVVGIEPEQYYQIVDIPAQVMRGTARLTHTDILIGIELARELGVDVGDKVRISTASGSNSTLTVAGIFDLGNKGANQRIVYVALHSAQTLLGLVGGTTSIEVTIKDVYAADTVAHQISASTGIEAESWIAVNAQFFSAVQAQKTSNTTIRIFVGLSVAFGIASVLVVSVVQKSREIGILRAIGVARGAILRVFLIEGGVLGLLGALAGSVVGVVALLLWQRFARNPDGTPLFALTIDPMLLGTALVLATCTGLLAAFAPALRAARLDPVEAIRG